MHANAPDMAAARSGAEEALSNLSGAMQKTLDALTPYLDPARTPA
jgi:hypothetical protein